MYPVEINHFGWRHAGRKNPAIEDIALTIPPGQKVLLLGASGAGKSTLLAGIAGVLGDDDEGEATGEILVGGMPPQQARGRVGMVLQDPDSQVIAARVGDDVVFGCENLGIAREEMWERAAAALRLVGLDTLNSDDPTEDVMERSTARLSGGQKQRLALAGVLAMRPGVIVLDEPTANLDPEGVEEVREAVIRAATDTGATLVIVEHRVETWQDYVDRVIVLAPPSAPRPIVADGVPAAILTRYADDLVAAGIWVPGVPLDIPRLPSSAHDRALVRTEDLTIGWDATTPVRRHLNIGVNQGSTVLRGHNGAGKTTLALTLGGLLAPLAGRVDASATMRTTRRISPAKAQPHTWSSRHLVQRIGYVFQDPEHQFAARTVEEELLLGPKAAGMDAEHAHATAERLLGELGLVHVARANPFTLSGGEKRRLSVATMLATNPALLILDEPTFGQDRRTFSTLVRMLQDLVAGGTALLSISHSAEYTELMGQQILELGDGSGKEHQP